MGTAAKVAASDCGEGGHPDAIALMELFPERWTALVRNAPLADVQPFGTRPLQQPYQTPKFGVP